MTSFSPQPGEDALRGALSPVGKGLKIPGPVDRGQVHEHGLDARGTEQLHHPLHVLPEAGDALLGRIFPRGIPGNGVPVIVAVVPAVAQEGVGALEPSAQVPLQQLQSPGRGISKVRPVFDGNTELLPGPLLILPRQGAVAPRDIGVDHLQNGIAVYVQLHDKHLAISYYLVLVTR